MSKTWTAAVKKRRKREVANGCLISVCIQDIMRMRLNTGATDNGDDDDNDDDNDDENDDDDFFAFPVKTRVERRHVRWILHFSPQTRLKMSYRIVQDRT